MDSGSSWLEDDASSVESDVSSDRLSYRSGSDLSITECRAYTSGIVDEFSDLVVDSFEDEVKESLRSIISANKERLTDLLDGAYGKMYKHDKWERYKMEQIYAVVFSGKDKFAARRASILEGEEEAEVAPHLDYDFGDFFSDLAQQVSEALTLEDQVVLIEKLVDHFDASARAIKLAPVMNDPWGVDDEDWVPDEFIEDIDYGEGDEVTVEDREGAMSRSEEIEYEKAAEEAHKAATVKIRVQDAEWQYSSEPSLFDHLFEGKMSELFPDDIPEELDFGHVLDGSPYGFSATQDSHKILRSFIRALLQSVQTLVVELGEMTV